MTAKSKMVYGRLLCLGGKGRLIVIRYACLWQNAPVQILVTYTSRRIPPRHYGLIRNIFTVIWSCVPTKSGVMQSFQTCIPFSIKDLQMPFQKVPFYRAKGRLLHLKRAPFTMRKGIFYFTKNHLLFPIYESLLQPSNALFLFITSKYLALRIIITTQ